jgi:hypothetical protein
MFTSGMEGLGAGPAQQAREEAGPGFEPFFSFFYLGRFRPPVEQVGASQYAKSLGVSNLGPPSL